MAYNKKLDIAGNNAKPDDKRVYQEMQEATSRTQLASQLVSDARMLSSMHPFKDEIETKCFNRLKENVGKILGIFIEEENEKRNQWTRVCKHNPCAEAAVKGGFE